MVAIVVSDELHAPPAVASDNVPVAPVQMEEVPDIAAITGSGDTVITLYAVPEQEPDV